MENGSILRNRDSIYEEACASLDFEIGKFTKIKQKS